MLLLRTRGVGALGDARQRRNKVEVELSMTAGGMKVTEQSAVEMRQHSRRPCAKHHFMAVKSNCGPRLGAPTGRLLRRPPPPPPPLASSSTSISLSLSPPIADVEALSLWPPPAKAANERSTSSSLRIGLSKPSSAPNKGPSKPTDGARNRLRPAETDEPVEVSEYDRCRLGRD